MTREEVSAPLEIDIVGLVLHGVERYENRLLRAGRLHVALLPRYAHVRSRWTPCGRLGAAATLSSPPFQVRRRTAKVPGTAATTARRPLTRISGSCRNHPGTRIMTASSIGGFNILNLGANYPGSIEGTVLIAAAAVYTLGAQPRRERGLL